MISVYISWCVCLNTPLEPQKRRDKKIPPILWGHDRASRNAMEIYGITH